MSISLDIAIAYVPPIKEICLFSYKKKKKKKTKSVFFLQKKKRKKNLSFSPGWRLNFPNLCYFLFFWQVLKANL
jgi:hypothetical protein